MEFSMLPNGALGATIFRRFCSGLWNSGARQLSRAGNYRVGMGHASTFIFVSYAILFVLQMDFCI